MTADREFLLWLANRLVNVYGESPNVDFVQKTVAIACGLPPQEDTKWNLLSQHAWDHDKQEFVLPTRPANAWPVNAGGLFRCCIANLSDQEQPSTEGDRITCPHCNESIRLVNGVWTWVH